MSEENLIEGNLKVRMCVYVCVCVLVVQHIQPSVSPKTVAHQDPPSVGFSRQKYWSGLPFPSPGDLPDPEIKPRSPTLQSDFLPSEPAGKPKSGGNSVHFFISEINTQPLEFGSITIMIQRKLI